MAKIVILKLENDATAPHECPKHAAQQEHCGWCVYHIQTYVKMYPIKSSLWS